MFMCICIYSRIKWGLALYMLGKYSVAELHPYFSLQFSQRHFCCWVKKYVYIFIIYNLLLFLHVWVFCLHVYIPCACQVPTESREGIRSLGMVLQMVMSYWWLVILPCDPPLLTRVTHMGMDVKFSTRTWVIYQWLCRQTVTSLPAAPLWPLAHQGGAPRAPSPSVTVYGLSLYKHYVGSCLYCELVFATAMLCL